MQRLLYRVLSLAVLCLVGVLAYGFAAAKPEGELTYAMHVTLAPVWFDPGENTGIISPKMVQYGLYDALFKPMPEGRMTPSLAESFTMSPDKLTYEFTLRPHLTFHNGDPLTAEDVKFTFERYKGAAAKHLKDRVRAVEVVDARHVRFHLKAPWSDFLLFYATPASGAAWIVPKKYLESVGDDGFKQHPIGAGPYKALFIPLYAWVWHTGVGARVADASLGKIPLFYYTGPFEDMKLQGQ